MITSRMRHCHYLVVKIVKQGLVDKSGEGCPYTPGLHAFLNNNHMLRLLDTVADGLDVKRLQTDQINDLQQLLGYAFKPWPTSPSLHCLFRACKSSHAQAKQAS